MKFGAHESLVRKKDMQGAGDNLEHRQKKRQSNITVTFLVGIFLVGCSCQLDRKHETPSKAGRPQANNQQYHEQQRSGGSHKHVHQTRWAI
jgi:uncharacterized protein YceK